MKNFFLIIFVLILYQCGFTSVYKNTENQNIKVIVQNVEGDKAINNLIKSEIKKYSKHDTENVYTVDAKTIYTKTTISKDKTGKATNLQLTVRINFAIKLDDKSKSFSFVETLSIENSSNSYEQNNYEKEIKKNFVNSIIQKLFLELLKIK